MKRLTGSLTLLFLYPCLLFAGVMVKGEKSYAPFDPIILQAKDVGSGKISYLWDIDGKAKKREAGDTCYVWAPPGTYTVKLTTIDFKAEKVERAEFTFTVTGDVPSPNPPPNPNPNPTPTPTKLSEALQKAYTANGEKDKATSLASMAAVYREASNKEFLDACQTGAKVRESVLATLRRFGLAGKIRDVQTVINDFLTKELPDVTADSTTPLTLESRGVIAGVFKQVANALGQVK